MATSSQPAALSLKEIVEIAFRAATGLSLVIYIMGLLIVNTYYGQVGFGLLKAEYFFAGTVWFVLVVVTAAAAKAIPLQLGRRQAALADAPGKRLNTLAKVAVTVFQLVVVTSVPLYMFTLDYHANENWRFWRAFGVLFGIHILGTYLLSPMLEVGSLYFTFVRAKQRNGFPSVTETIEALEESREARRYPQGIRHFLYFAPIYATFYFLASVGAYAVWVFPVISPSFGGGQATPIQLVASASQVPILQAAGITMIDDHLTQPLYLLLETDSTLLLLPPKLQVGPGKPKAIDLKKSSIESLLYLQPKHDQ